MNSTGCTNQDGTGQGEIVGPEAAVEINHRQGEDATGRIGQGGLPTRRQAGGHRADQRAGIVKLPQRPDELEEGVDEDAGQQQELQLEHGMPVRVQNALRADFE